MLEDIETELVFVDAHENIMVSIVHDIDFRNIRVKFFWHFVKLLLVFYFLLDS